MEASQDNYLKALSNYSRCIYPYLKTVQDKYVTSEVLDFSDDVDLSAHCKGERELVESLKANLLKD